MPIEFNTMRQDLSEWALHFIHDYNSDSEPMDQMIDFDRYNGFPYHEDEKRNARFDSWRISDRSYPIDPDPDAFQVLLKIITDGHIRATWAFKNKRPAVYGPRAAVCFTEMPLYALVEYAKQRANNTVRTYAIGILKRELFGAGGRPVIYGLSGNRDEQKLKRPFNRVWPRYLSPSCGIGDAEQYRYVAMSTDPRRPIDWSHEREWRWVDHKDNCSCPGLPIWLSEEPFSFSRAFVVVPDAKEAELVLDRLKELHDAGANDFDHLFSKKALGATSVIALDQLDMDPDAAKAKPLRLDDIPAVQIQRFTRPRVSPGFIKKVRRVLTEARSAADDAAQEHLKSASRTADGHVADVVGWAHLVVHGAQSPLVSALLQLKEGRSTPGIGYYIEGIGGLGWRNEQALSLAEAAVKAAMAVFEKHFPENSFDMVSTARRDVPLSAR